jgi:hypothetical protein
MDSVFQSEQNANKGKIMTLDQNELMTIATWLAVAENEFNVTSYEYQLMAKLAEASGNDQSMDYYIGKHHEALMEEMQAEAEWQAEEEAEARAM